MDSLNRKCDDKTCKLKEVKVISSFSILFRDQWTAMRCIFASMFKECCKGYFCAHLHSGLRSFALICAHMRSWAHFKPGRKWAQSFVLICAHLRSFALNMRSFALWAQMSAKWRYCAHERSLRSWAQMSAQFFKLFQWAQMSAKWTTIWVSANERNYFNERKWAQNKPNICVSANERKYYSERKWAQKSRNCAHLRSFALICAHFAH